MDCGFASIEHLRFVDSRDHGGLDVKIILGNTHPSFFIFYVLVLKIN